MGESESLDHSLPELFERASQVASEAASASGRLSEEQTLRYKEAERWLRQCEVMIEQLALFSSNEEADDIATADLKYLLTSYYLATLQQLAQIAQPSRRKEALVAAAVSYARFSRLCDQYGLVPESAKVSQDSDPQTKRELKIERFKQLKASKDQLSHLQQRAMRNRRLQELDDSENGFHDESTEREAWLTQIKVSVLQAAENQQQLKQEIELLSHAENLPEEERQKPLPKAPAEMLQKLHLAASNLGSNLGEERQRIAANVFRPTHNLPTRSLREQADIEIEQAEGAAKRQAKAEKAKKELEKDEDYMTEKARAWDDWKDEHPRGSGNSKLRPTA